MGHEMDGQDFLEKIGESPVVLMRSNNNNNCIICMGCIRLKDDT